MNDIISIGYFTERYDSEQRWLATSLKFHAPPAPFYRVYTGGKHQRFILATPTFKCHWGQFLPGLDGIRLLRNPIDISMENMPITRISSTDIEVFKQRNPDNVLQYWAGIFADNLLRSSTHFLYAGDWEIIL